MMTHVFRSATLGLAVMLIAATVPGLAQKAKSGTGAPFAGFGSSSKEPIRIDSNRLEVFDKENRAVYSGDVVVVQGQTTVRSSQMIVHYITNKTGGGNSTPGAGQNSIRKIDFEGPVSVSSGTQAATGKFMTYDAQAETVTLTGNVIISDCDNVQRGERAVYDVKTGRATVDAGAKGRVQGVFTPGSDDKKKAAGECGPRTN
ncbi:MAG: lipopolysaccharide transport periplasmic protein LptA [Rhabdaerophilum sp.]